MLFPHEKPEDGRHRYSHDAGYTETIDADKSLLPNISFNFKDAKCQNLCTGHNLLKRNVNNRNRMLTDWARMGKTGQFDKKERPPGHNSNHPEPTRK